MNIGMQILKIRKEKGLTQEEFGKIFHVTRQTVSNWENEKSYPDLQILIDISNRFDDNLTNYQMEWELCRKYESEHPAEQTE